MIKLKTVNSFIGENTATALDMEGKKVEGSLAEHYVLKKED